MNDGKRELLRLLADGNADDSYVALDFGDTVSLLVDVAGADWLVVENDMQEPEITRYGSGSGMARTDFVGMRTEYDRWRHEQDTRF